MALQINFASRDGNTGNYVNFDVRLGKKIGTIIKGILLLHFWKDKTTRDTKDALPYNDLLAGGKTERIVGFNCVVPFDYDLESELNVCEQGYAHLKKLPEYNKEGNKSVDLISD